MITKDTQVEIIRIQKKNDSKDGRALNQGK